MLLYLLLMTVMSEAPGSVSGKQFCKSLDWLLADVVLAARWGDLQRASHSSSSSNGRCGARVPGEQLRAAGILAPSPLCPKGLQDM